MPSTFFFPTTTPPHPGTQAPLVELPDGPLGQLLAGVVDLEQLVVAVVGAVVSGLGPQIIFPVEQRAGCHRRLGRSEQGDAGEGDERREDEQEEIAALVGHCCGFLRESGSGLGREKGEKKKVKREVERRSFSQNPEGKKTEKKKPEQRLPMSRRVILLLVALVAAVGAALFSSAAAARVLLDWEDDLRPR